MMKPTCLITWETQVPGSSMMRNLFIGQCLKMVSMVQLRHQSPLLEQEASDGVSVETFAIGAYFYEH